MTKGLCEILDRSDVPAELQAESTVHYFLGSFSVFSRIKHNGADTMFCEIKDKGERGGVQLQAWPTDGAWNLTEI